MPCQLNSLRIATGTLNLCRMPADRSTKIPGPRPAAPVGTPVEVLLQSEDLAALDAWRDAQANSLSRPEAVLALLRAGLQGSRNRVDDATRSRILAALDQGGSIRQVASTFGVGPSTVYRIGSAQRASGRLQRVS